MYEHDISIDQLDLEFELVRQASLYLKYSELSIEANFERDKLKERIKLVETEIDLGIRQNPTEYGFDSKPTETAIRACIIQQKEYQDINKDYIEAVRLLNQLNGAKTALEHKKKALELLVTLIIRGYSAEPKVDSEFKKQHQEGGHKTINRTLAQSERLAKRKKPSA